MLTIVNNVIHVDLLVQEKRRVSLMYFCTHENINVFISTDRSSFPNNKISIFTGRPPISSIFNSMIMLFLSKLNLLQYNRKCSEHSFLYPHEQEALGTNFDLNKSLFRELHLFLSLALACNTLRYRSAKKSKTVQFSVENIFVALWI